MSVDRWIVCITAVLVAVYILFMAGYKTANMMINVNANHLRINQLEKILMPKVDSKPKPREGS